VDFAEFKSLERLLGRSNGEGTQGERRRGNDKDYKRP
jgi:hypothetical protein